MTPKILDPSNRVFVRKSMVATEVSKDVGTKHTFIKSTYVQSHNEVRPGAPRLGAMRDASAGAAPRLQAV